MHKRWEMILEYQFESLNKMMRMHWAVRKKRQQELMAAVEYAAPRPLLKFTGRTRLTIIRQWGKNRKGEAIMD